MPRLRLLIVPVVAVLLSGCPTFENERPRDQSARRTPSPAARMEPGPMDEDAPEEFTETESGLKYRILRKSDGRKPKATDTVSAHYRGWVDGGTVFDSSYDKGGAPVEFSLRDVIPGWTEGLQLIGEGGMIELEIPGKLGYADDPPAGTPITPNATLHFLVELVEVH